MMFGITGTSLVTPLGSDPAALLEQVRSGTPPHPTFVSSPDGSRTFPVLRVPDEAIAGNARWPRLRRSSTISHLVMTAALGALRNAGIDPENPGRRIAVVFAASDGGVIYTRKFFNDLVERGTKAGSPLLFPETVYNAPASHIAARLGIDGTATTVVGDASAGLHAVAMGGDLLLAGECDVCVVAAAEEVDWVVADAYAQWGIGGEDGVIFSDGAAALVLENDAPVRATVDCGASFSRLRDSVDALAASIERVRRETNAACVISSDTGGKFAVAEDAALIRSVGTTERLRPKRILGEAFAASTLTQMALAHHIVTSSHQVETCLVPVLGWNGQCGCARIERQ